MTRQGESGLTACGGIFDDEGFRLDKCRTCARWWRFDWLRHNATNTHWACETPAPGTEACGRYVKGEGSGVDAPEWLDDFMRRLHIRRLETRLAALRDKLAKASKTGDYIIGDRRHRRDLRDVYAETKKRLEQAQLTVRRVERKAEDRPKSPSGRKSAITDNEAVFIIRHYPDKGMDYIMRHLPHLSRTIIRSFLQRKDIKLTKEAKHRMMSERARERGTKNDKPKQK